MKKFLTVLLALSVVFTYTVGTAFALPSDGEQTAGLDAAKAEAVTEIENYVTLSDYTATGQTLIKAVITECKEKISEAKKIGEVEDAVTTAKGKIDALYMYEQDAVDEALKAAGTQIVDYLYLFGAEVNINQYNLGSLLTEIKDGNIDLDGLGLSDADATAFTDALYKSAQKLYASASTDEVEEFLNDTLKVIDKYMNKLYSEEVSDAQRQALVDEILKFAKDNNIATDNNYSKTVVTQFDKTVNEAVAAAKAVKSMKDYYDVIEKYLGTNWKGTNVKAAKFAAENKPVTGEYGKGFVVIKSGAVYVYTYSAGELNALVGLNKDKEAQIAAAKKIQAKLGEYDYSKVAIDQWEDAEDFYAMIDAWADGDIASGDKIAKRIKASTSDSDVDKFVDEMVAEYETMTTLYQAKYLAKIAVKAFYGYDEEEAAMGDDSEFAGQPDVQKQIATLQKVAENTIDAATSETEVLNCLKDYMAKVDSYNTDTEKAIAENYASISNGIDFIVAFETEKVDLTADQKTLLNRLIADLKASIKATGEDVAGNEVYDTAITMANRDVVVPTYCVTPGGLTLGDLFTNLKDFTKDGGKFGYQIVFTDDGFSRTVYDKGTYKDSDKKYMEAEIAKVKEAAAAKDQTWAGYLAAYDAAVAACDKYSTIESVEFNAALEAAKKAVNAIGPVEDTVAFYQQLAAAEKALDELSDVIEYAFNIRDGITKAELDFVIGLVPEISKLYSTFYDLEYASYLLQNQAVAADKDITKAYFDIATVITGSDVLKKFSADDQKAILKYVQDTNDQLLATKDISARAEIAEKAIAYLQGFQLDNTDPYYAGKLAANKEEAVKYFNKYYKAAFTSDAVTAAALIEDIIEFNEKLLPDPAADALKAEVKGTHMKIGSSAAKGYIKISWKASNTTVALDGVEVYRSTKKTTGFKKISTFKVQTSKKYTTGLKKGTKYYYYVKGYKMVGDEKVYTHDSITVGRTFR